MFVVLDAEGVEEIAEHGRLAAHEPHLEEVRGDLLALRTAEGGLEPGVAFGAGFALDEHGPQLALGGEGLDGDLVRGLFGFLQET